MTLETSKIHLTYNVYRNTSQHIHKFRKTNSTRLRRLTFNANSLVNQVIKSS